MTYKLPHFLRDKLTRHHQIALMGDDIYIKIIPYALYRRHGGEVCTTDLKFYSSEIYCHVGSYADEVHPMFEIYNPKNKTWENLLDVEAMYKASVYTSDIKYIENNYGDSASITYEYDKGWILFDVSKWVKENVSAEIEIDLYKCSAKVRGMGKFYKIEELEDWNSDWHDNSGKKLVIPRVDLLDELVRELKKQLEVVKNACNLKDIYDKIQSNEMTYEEFITKL